MIFTNNNWGKHEILNNVIILTKQGADTIYTVILTKYQKSPSTAILQHANVLAKVNKSPDVWLLNMTPHDTYSVTIIVRTIILADISHGQKE